MDLAFIRKLLKFCSKCNCRVQCLQSALRYRISMHIPRTDPYPIYSEFCEYGYINHKLYPRHNFWTDPYILKLCENGSGYESRLATFTTSVAEKQTWLCNWAGSLHWIFEVSKMLGFQIYCRKSPICLRICVGSSETLATNLRCPDTETCHMGLPKTGTVQQLQPQLGDKHVTSEPCWMYMWYMRYMRMHYVHCILTVYIYNIYITYWHTYQIYDIIHIYIVCRYIYICVNS